MSYYTNDITEQYLNKLYDDMQREQTKLMNDLKGGDKEPKEERDLVRQISIITTITMAVVKLKNLRRIKNTD